MKLGDLIGKLSETEGFDIEVVIHAGTDMDEGELAEITDVSYSHLQRSVLLKVEGRDHKEDMDEIEHEGRYELDED